MNAKKCDRCGVFYDSYGREVNETDSDKIKRLFEGYKDGVRMSKSDGYISPHIDLCPTCLEELIKWLDNQQVTGNL